MREPLRCDNFDNVHVTKFMLQNFLSSSQPSMTKNSFSAFHSFFLCPSKFHHIFTHLRTLRCAVLFRQIPRPRYYCAVNCPIAWSYRGPRDPWWSQRAHDGWVYYHLQPVWNKSRKVSHFDSRKVPNREKFHIKFQYILICSKIKYSRLCITRTAEQTDQKKCSSYTEFRDFPYGETKGKSRRLVRVMR